MSLNLKSWNHFYWHLLLLGSLIFSHPLFNSLGSQPEFLLAHNLTGLNLLLWIVAIAIIPGLLLVSFVSIATRILRPLSDKIKAASLFLLFAVFIFVQINGFYESSPVLPGFVSCVLAFFTLRAYDRSIYIRTFFSYAAFLVVVTPMIFSFGGDVRQILLPHQMADDLIAEKPIDKNPVVILVLDELPLMSLLDSEGNINSERFPNFANFSSQSNWYRYASTVAESTLNAVPAILTGQLTVTNDSKLPLAANYPVNLFTLLSPSHEVNGYETFTHMCPEDLCKSLKPDWKMIAEDTLVVFAHNTAPEQYRQDLPEIDNKWVGYLRKDGESRDLHNDQTVHPHHRYKLRMEKFGEFLSELEDIDPASLNYLHFLMPHSPWMYLPDGRTYSQAEIRAFTGIVPPGTPGIKIKGQLYSEPHLIEQAHQRHLLQMGYVDGLLGDVFSVLQSRQMFDDALIVVMADHGVSFRPGESLRQATEASFQDILSVPLFIKYPGQKQGEINLQAARSIDVLPTVLDALDYEFNPFEFEGKSLLQAVDSEQITLSLARDTGEILEYPFADFKARLEESVKNRQKALTEGSFDEIYALNEASLFGIAVQELPAENPVEYTLNLDHPHLYDDVMLSGNSIPVLIRANRSVWPENPSKKTVAVSVNGIIRGVSLLQRIETVEFDFQVLVAPESFRGGANSIRFYQVNKAAGTASLSPILFESNSQAELIRKTDNALSLDLDGSQFEVVDTGRYGEIRLILDNKTNQVRLTGWSFDSSKGRVATEIFFFAGDKQIASVKPHARYPKAQELTGFANAKYSGFNLILPIMEQTRSGPEPFVAVAMFGPDTNPSAAELRYFNGARQFFKTRKIKRSNQTLEQRMDKNAIEPGRIYNFSDDTQALLFSGSGWSKTSSSAGRWNASVESSLNFRVINNKFPLELTVQCSPLFVKGKHETQSIKASFPSGNSQLITLKREEKKGRFIIRIAPEDIATDGTVLINLEYLNAASPKSLGVNNDGRLLALKIKSLQVLIAEVASDL